MPQNNATTNKNKTDKYTISYTYIPITVIVLISVNAPDLYFTISYFGDEALTCYIVIQIREYLNQMPTNEII
jgi:hypothetical protein